jgi:hypothetical protein
MWRVCGIEAHRNRSRYCRRVGAGRKRVIDACSAVCYHKHILLCSIESILSHPSPVSGVGEGVGDGHAVDERADCGVGDGYGEGVGDGGATMSVGVGDSVVAGDGHGVSVAGVGVGVVAGDRAVSMRWLYPVA